MTDSPSGDDATLDLALETLRLRAGSGAAPDATIRHVPAALTSTTLVLPAAGPAEAGPAEPDPLPPLRFEGGAPDLEVRAELGEGGMGTVALALQRALRREVAVKRVRPGAGPAAVAALLREAHVTGSLEHPNIVPVHLLGRDAAGLPVLVMQRIAGTAWRELIDDPEHPHWAHLPGDRLRHHLEILIQVSNALHYAHDRGIVHRDVKPENVMIGAFGEVYLLDWGLALSAADEPPSEAIVGTPAYLAPEMLEGDARVDERTDVYLLGATLHHALTGRVRHPGGLRGALRSVLRSEPVAYPSEVPAELAELANHATARDPARRPASALAFRLALESFLQHRGSIRLCAEAGERLAELRALLAGEGPHEGEAVAALVAQTRFGFEQALRSWPENPQARAGLQACLELAIEHELAQRHKGLVASLLAELPRPRPDLEERLAQLAAELDAEARTGARLRDMERDLDLRIAGRQRAWFLLALAVVGSLVQLPMAILEGRGAVTLTHGHVLAFNAGLLAVLVAGAFLGRRWLLKTQVSRRLVAAVSATLAGLFLNQGLGYAFEGPLPQIIVHDDVVICVGLYVIGAALDRRVLPVAHVALAMTLASAVWIEQILFWQTAGTFLAFAAGAWISWVEARE